MSLKTIAGIAALHGFTDLGRAGHMQKRISPIFTAIVLPIDSDHFCTFEPITSLDQRCRVDLVDDDGIVQFYRVVDNFAAACAYVEAWKIRDLERRADLSVGLPMFLQPQAE